MDSKKALLSLVAIAVLALDCTATPRPFSPRPPLVRDTDLQSVSVPCHLEPTPKDPRHVSCAPVVYVSPLVWDGLDNSVFRPLSEVFAVEATREARNANSLDEVADSAWFTNRIGVRDVPIGELHAGACRPAELLDPASADQGSWVIDQGKANGASLGFRVNIAGKGKYLFKIDDREQPERATAASVIGAAAYEAVGFFTSCEQIVEFDPSLLKLTPGLHSEDNRGGSHPFDNHALEQVLASATHHGGLVRMQASAWLPGHLIGPFRYEGTRDDDPNDAIPHEDRRELRGARLLAAWLNHFDAREQNTMDTWIADHAEAADSSPGYVRHYYLDTSDSLGSEWAWDGISRRLGRSYLLDWGDIGADFVTLGIPARSWERAQRTPGREKFGYFDVATFDPEGWKNEYPNPAFSRMTERDGAWMARILARFTPERVATLVAMGRFSDSGDTQYLGGVLEGRLERILRRYLGRLSPLGDVRVESGDRVCATDLARARRVFDDGTFRYSAKTSAGVPLATTSDGDGAVCVALPSPAAAPSTPRYVVITIVDGAVPGALVVHLYDRGPGVGYELAGLERTEGGS